MTEKNKKLVGPQFKMNWKFGIPDVKHWSWPYLPCLKPETNMATKNTYDPMKKCPSGFSSVNTCPMSLWTQLLSVHTKRNSDMFFVNFAHWWAKERVVSHSALPLASHVSLKTPRRWEHSSGPDYYIIYYITGFRFMFRFYLNFQFCF